MKRSGLFQTKIQISLLASILISVPLSVAVTSLVLWCQPNALRVVIGNFVSQPLLAVLNVLPQLLLILFFGFLFRNIFFSASVVNLLVCLLSIANRIKIEVRDEPVFPRDLALLKEVGSAVGNYDIHYPWTVIAIVVIFSLATALLGVFIKVKPVSAKRFWRCLVSILGSAVSAAFLVVLIFTVFSSNELYNSFNTTNPYYIPSVFNELGFPYCFCHQFTAYPVDRPEGFDRTEAELWDREETGEDDGKPINVVMVMNEAFSDVTDLDMFTWDDDPLSNLHALRKDSHAIAGHVVVPNFAAGTANTEFDVLTGIQTNSLSAAATSAFRLVNRDMDSLFRVYANAGYETSFLHPGDDWFYNRENVYRWLGAEKTLFRDEMEGELTYKGSWVTDECMAGIIEREFENAVDSGVLLFNYTTTIQNHMSYTMEKYGSDYAYPTVHSSVALSQDVETMLGVYAMGVRDADEMLGSLVEFFTAREEPVLLVFFGDHLPYLGDNQLAYRELGVTDKPLWNELTSFETPYIIWSNEAGAEILDWDSTVKSLDLPDDGRISAAFLGATVLELTGREGNTSWFSFLNNIRREVPVVQKQTFVTADGAVTEQLEESFEREIDKWRKWSYYKLRYKDIEPLAESMRN